MENYASTTAAAVASDTSNLTERKPSNHADDTNGTDASAAIVYGITPDSTRFAVPVTHDMVSNLFDLRVKKSFSDIVIVAILSCYVLLFFLLPSAARIPVFLLLFGFWRLAYNGGIGWLLDQQSRYKTLTKWAAQSKVFEKSNSLIHQIIKSDLTAKLGSDYDFYGVPLEYNTWLIFREVVDLILMSDFTCYMMLVFSCYSPSTQPALLIASRWIAGIILFFFNLWVKLDAHRVVKDYAWYWGDFFFLEDLDLTFDGVFEMAPHPMYSIGYAGYYGFCLMTASYTLFFASVIAHAAQFVFLIYVENPHIDKTYNTVPTKKSRIESFSSNGGFGGFDSEEPDTAVLRAPLLVFKNFNFTRSSDTLLVLLASTTALQVFAPRNSTIWTLITFSSALGWRLIHNVGLGYVLRNQSDNKFLTRVFLKYGRSAVEAYEDWQVIYNASTVMSYTTLGVYTLRVLNSPIGVSYWPFRYIVGAMLIALQLWTSYSIYESLGEYGWFFGDFFYLRDSNSLTYSGIYRYLNNPERLCGIAGVWGVALITGNLSVAFIAFVWTVGGMAFIQFVEQPHMQKLYGDQIRREAGVVKTIKQAAKIPSPFDSRVKQFQGSVDKVLSETSNAVETFLGQAKPRISGATKKVNETRVLLKEYPARLTIVHVSDDVNVNTALYGLKIDTPSIGQGVLQYELGTPLRVSWTADTQHSKRDWIGLYRVTSNISADVTRITSHGKWSAVQKDGYKDHTDSVVEFAEDGNSGVVEFSGSMLPWQVGVYEFRYHHDGKHNVLSISQPFEIVSSSKPIGGNATELAHSLIPLISRCFDGTNSTIPSSPEDHWDIDDDRALQRLVYGIKESYGVDIAPSVVLGDRTPLHLAARLIAIKQALQPFVSIKTNSPKRG